MWVSSGYCPFHIVRVTEDDTRNASTQPANLEESIESKLHGDTRHGGDLDLAIGRGAGVCSDVARAEESRDGGGKGGGVTPPEAARRGAKSTAKGSTKSREQMKAETAAANKAGELTPAGGGAAPASKTAATGPTKTREQRKAETMEAKKKGELRPPGQ